LVGLLVPVEGDRQPPPVTARLGEPDLQALGAKSAGPARAVRRWNALQASTFSSCESYPVQVQVAVAVNDHAHVKVDDSVTLMRSAPRNREEQRSTHGDRDNQERCAMEPDAFQQVSPPFDQAGRCMTVAGRAVPSEAA